MPKIIRPAVFLDRDGVLAEELESEAQTMCNLSKGVYDQGIQQGEELVASLMQKLFALGRTDDARRASEDKEYREQLIKCCSAN